MDLVVNQGVATLAQMPYSDRDYLTQPDTVARQEAARYPGKSWKTANGTLEIKGALANRLPVAIGVAVFQVRPSSVAHLVLAGVSSLGLSGLMMALSVVGRTPQSVGGLSWALLLMMSMLGGGMMPLFIMPSWMVTAGHLSPVKWAILAFEGALWRGFSTPEMLLPCAMLVAVGLLGLAVGARLYPRP